MLSKGMPARGLLGETTNKCMQPRPAAVSFRRTFSGVTPVWGLLFYTFCDMGSSKVGCGRGEGRVRE